MAAAKACPDPVSASAQLEPSVSALGKLGHFLVPMLHLLVAACYFCLGFLNLAVLVLVFVLFCRHGCGPVVLLVLVLLLLLLVLPVPLAACCRRGYALRYHAVWLQSGSLSRCRKEKCGCSAGCGAVACYAMLLYHALSGLVLSGPVLSFCCPGPHASPRSVCLPLPEDLPASHRSQQDCRQTRAKQPCLYPFRSTRS